MSYKVLGPAPARTRLPPRH